MASPGRAQVLHGACHRRDKPLGRTGDIAVPTWLCIEQDIEQIEKMFESEALEGDVRAMFILVRGRPELVRV